MNEETVTAVISAVLAAVIALLSCPWGWQPVWASFVMTVAFYFVIWYAIRVGRI